jgi:hypothetical protein
VDSHRKKGDTIKLLHTTRVEEKFVSGLFEGILSFIPFPTPFSFRQHEWSDHQTIRVAFKPDSCLNTNCEIVGIDTLNLPPKTNIRAGLLTIEYIEGELLRSLSFRIPANAKIEIVKKIRFTSAR